MHRLEPKTSASRALTLVLSNTSPIERKEMVPSKLSLGRVVASDVRSRINIPPFPSSHVDGYAMRSIDTKRATWGSPVRLTEVGEVHAGECFKRRLNRGETVAIATGAQVPQGADSVEMFEEVTSQSGTVCLRNHVRPGQFVDPVGEDLRKGQLVAGEGEAITPATIGALRISGHEDVSVFSRPRVAVVANGNELAEPGRPLVRGRVYESNTAVLCSVVDLCGGIPVPRNALPDNEHRIEVALRKALRDCDMVVVSGGSSVGERDYLRTVFPKLGKLLFHGVRVRPGMPTLAAVAGKKAIIGLPGHPASCLTNAIWLLVPALRKMARLPGNASESVEVTMVDGARVHGHGFSTVVPLHIDGGRAKPTFHGSHFITSLSGANGFVLLPPSKGELKKGERLTVQKLALGTGG